MKMISLLRRHVYIEHSQSMQYFAYHLLSVTVKHRCELQVAKFFKHLLTHTGQTVWETRLM